MSPGKYNKHPLRVLMFLAVTVLVLTGSNAWAGDFADVDLRYREVDFRQQAIISDLTNNVDPSRPESSDAYWEELRYLLPAADYPGYQQDPVYPEATPTMAPLARPSDVYERDGALPWNQRINQPPPELFPEDYQRVDNLEQEQDHDSFPALEANPDGNLAKFHSLEVENPELPVDFPDPNLEAVVRTALGKVSGAITRGDLAGLNYLDARKRGITNISGLEFAVNLEQLRLWNNQITDLSPLADLLSLWSLDLQSNYISNIFSLSGLYNLRRLNLGWNTLGDSELGNIVQWFPQLENLNFQGNRVTDISVLAGLSILGSLSLDDNQISDITPLSGLNNLHSLYLSHNNLGSNDLKKIVDWFPELQLLRFGRNGISDISVLGGLKSLWYLDLGNNQINDISTLSNLTSLKYLRIDNNQINDLSSLAGLTSLTQLYLYGNRITDISSLASLTALQSLNLERNQIDDIAVLANLTGLRNLYSGDNQISDISVLADLTNLQDLNLSNNRITDIAALVTNSNNGGFTNQDPWDDIDLRRNYLDLAADSLDMADIQFLLAKGVAVEYQPQLRLVENPELSVEFPDANLEAAVRKVLGKTSGDITSGDLAGLTRLEAGGRGIADLTGLEYAINLDWLGLKYNRIKDLTPLINLTNLSELWIWDNQITDISALSGLTSLRYLNLGHNFISDFSSLAGLTSLYYLNLSYNQISDISLLSNHINLGQLYLHYNKLTDISPLIANSDHGGLGDRDSINIRNNYLDLTAGSQSMTDLQTLLNRGVYLEYQPQRRMVDNPELPVDFTDPNLEAVVRATLGKTSGTITRGDLAKLIELDAYGKGISDLTGLEHAVNLEQLWFWDNQIADVTPLTGLTSLRAVELGRNQISDLSPLSGLENLRNLYLSWNDLDESDLINIADWFPQLESLGFGGHGVSDLSSLAGLSLLQVLYLDNNQIDNVSDLAGLTSLRTLGLGRNEINDITALTDLYNLRWLMIDNNQISDISALAGLTSLNSLGSYSNQISDITPLTNMVNLNYLSLVNNRVTDIAPLVTNSNNGGLGNSDRVYLQNNYLDLTIGSQNMADLQILKNRGIYVYYQPQRRPVATQASVAIDNIANARPQAGLDQADIVYETAVAPGITRYLAVFDLANPVDKIGPVRSAREHLVGLAAGHGGGFAHAGGDSFSLAVLPKVPVVNLDEIYGSGSYFYRTTDRDMPYNLYTSASLLQQGLAASRQPLVAPGAPIPRGEMAGGAAAAAATVRFPGQGQDTVFQWNATSQDYQRIVNGQPDVLENDLPITAANVIVLFTDHRQEYQSNLDEWTIKARVEGTGDAFFYRDGKVWAGQWARNGWEAMFDFTVDGNPMQFAPGSVWVLITTTPGQQIVTIHDPGLNAAVRAALAKPQWNLTTADLASLTYLDASGRGIQDLAGLDQAVNLQYLDLSDNDIRDISPLLNAGFGSGITIDLSSNYLDLAPDSSAMTALQALGGNGVTVLYQPQLGGFSGRLRLQARAEYSGLMTTLGVPGGGAGVGGGPIPPIPPIAEGGSGGTGGVPPIPALITITQPPRAAVTLYSTAAGGPAYTTTTGAGGDFYLPRVETGSYTLVASSRGYLVATQQVTIEADSITDVGTLLVEAGDLDGDHQIGIRDLRLWHRAYGKKATGEDWNNSSQADFNGDGRVDLYDVALLARNFDQSAQQGAGAARALAAGRLRSLGIIEGDLDGRLRPGATLTRAEFTVIATILAGLKDEVAQYKQVMSPFSDVADSDWYSYWIKAAAAHGLLTGYPDGTFKPGGGVSNAEVITILLRLLGYNGNLPGDWPVDYMAKAAELGLTANLALDITAPAERADVFVMVNNLLDQKKVGYDQENDNFVESDERLVEELLGM